MIFKIGFLILSLLQFIGWEMMFFNGIYEEEKKDKSTVVLGNLFAFFIYVFCHGICWYMLLFGDTFSTELTNCKCIKYLFKTTKYCLRDLGYYSRSVLSNCALFIIMSMCISSINLAYGGVNLYLGLKREYERKNNPELSEMPGFIVSSVTFSSIFCGLAFITFIALTSIVIDITYQIYNTEPCPECGINGYCSSKLKLKRDQETWKRRRRLYLFTSAFFGKEYTNKLFPFDEDTVKFDLVFDKNKIINDFDRNNEAINIPLFKPENITVTNCNNKTL